MREKGKNIRPINNEIRDIFIDSIDPRIGFGSTTLPLSSPLYAVSVFGIVQLFKFGDTS